MTLQSTDDYERLVPAELRELVSSIVEVARGMLEKDGALQAVAFVGRLEPRNVGILGVGPLRNGSAAVTLIRAMADERNADFVLFVSEAWTFEGPKEEAEKLRAQYDEVQHIPGRIHAVMFALHTHVGFFVGDAERETVDEAAKRYTFGEIVFRMAQLGEGCMASMLPRKKWSKQ
jgi:hypothetical protein